METPLAIASTKRSFGDAVMGIVEGLKLIINQKDLIFTAKELPLWK